MQSENTPGKEKGTTRRKSRPQKLKYELDLPDFYDGTHRKPFISYYRSFFLDAVNRYVPEVLQSLREDVWKKGEGSFPRREERLRRWREEKLAKVFHLPSWILFHARTTMWLWGHNRVLPEETAWPSVSRGWSSSRSLPGDDNPFPLPPAWDPVREPWVQFETRATAWFRTALESHKRHMSDLAIQHGFKRTLRKRSRDGRHPLVGFDYLALYQVRLWSSERIATKFDTDSEGFSLRAEAVMEQIHWAADAIDLTLRPPSKPGRPRKKNS